MRTYMVISQFFCFALQGTALELPQGQKANRQRPHFQQFGGNTVWDILRAFLISTKINCIAKAIRPPVERQFIDTKR